MVYGILFLYHDWPRKVNCVEYKSKPNESIKNNCKDNDKLGGNKDADNFHGK